MQTKDEIFIQKLTLIKKRTTNIENQIWKKETKNLNQCLLFLLCGHVWSATPMRDGCVVHILRTCSYRIARTHRSTMFVDGRSIPPAFDFATVLDMAETNLWQKTILSHSFFWSTRLTCFIDNLITILEQIFIKKNRGGGKVKGKLSSTRCVAGRSMLRHFFPEYVILYHT